MKFLNYLNELILPKKPKGNPGIGLTKDLIEAISIIKKDCLIFLNQVKGKVNYPLIRHVQPAVTETQLIKKITRSNRKAMHTKQDVSDFYDNELKKKFGWKPRSEGVFCWGQNRNWAGDSRGFFMFPIGNFKFVWNTEVADLYASLPMSFSGATYFKVVENIMKNYTDKDLAAAINKSFEISIKCESYYLLAIRNNDQAIFDTWKELYE